METFNFLEQKGFFDMPFNPCLANISILYPQKTPESPWFFVFFRG